MSIDPPQYIIDPPQYIVAWPAAPQDVGLAVEAIDRFLDEANARSQGTV